VKSEILIRLYLSWQFFVGQWGENGRIGIVLNSQYMDWVCMCDAFGEPKMMPIRADINIKTIRKLLPYTYSGIKTTAVYRIPKLLLLSYLESLFLKTNFKTSLDYFDSIQFS